MSDLMQRLDSLSPEKRKLIELMRQERRAQRAAIQAIPRRETADPAPLSFAQQRLWFLHQLEPGSPIYNEHGALHFAGPLDPGLLERSLNAVVARHEVLRTTFVVEHGQPVQQIAPELRLALPLTDLSALPSTAQSLELRRLATAEAWRPFDLQRGPLLRAQLLRLRSDSTRHEHVLLVTLHHIISDGWSVGVLAREITALYAALAADPETAPGTTSSSLPVQYADFAAWQQQLVASGAIDEQLRYWRAQLQGESRPVELPSDYARPAEPSYRGAFATQTLPAALSQAVKLLAQQHDVTPFVTLLAAFGVLLRRLTGQEQIAVGAPVAGRSRTELEPLIGCFLNTLVLRIDLEGDPSGAALLAQLRQTVVDAYKHQELPFERLVQELRPERTLHQTPFFSVLFNVNNTPQTRLALPGVQISSLELAEPIAKFPLTLYIDETEPSLRLRALYQTELFSAARIEGLLEQFAQLLAQIVAAPSAPISSYTLVTPAARALLPDPAAPLERPHFPSVGQLVLAQASERPRQPALIADGHSWSYAELGNQAQQIAQLLLARGIQPGQVVAVSGPRSFGLIASVVGVLLSGGVLLLLDPRLPGERRQLLINEADVRHLLQIVSAAEPSDETTLPTTPIERETARPQASPPEHPSGLPPTEPDRPAYIFFTSGTTGVPKAVLGRHAGLSHFLSWQRATFAIGPDDRCAQLTGISFDVVLRDMLTPLISGATLCLPDDPDDLGADRIVPWLERARISLLHTTPSIAQSWLAQLHPGQRFTALRAIFFAGEPLPQPLARQWWAALRSGGSLVNLYGPTETTLAKCCYRIAQPADLAPQTQPVGWPLPQTQALILTPQGQLCGIGEIGEIVLRTPFRSLGYLNAPEEQQRRFRRNPHRHDDDDLLYFSGDQGRYRPDGAIEILGRIDQQVKIRGVRVEPDEIAAVLARHPAVESCVVVAHGPAEQRTLAAYVVPSEPSAGASESSQAAPEPGVQLLAPSDLRAFLRAQLPDALVPSSFTTLERIPLTANGKLDRAALPQPEQSSPDAPVAPRTPTELLVAEVWSQALGQPQIGIHSNFFELGGHSLLATTVMAQLRTTCQRDIPLRSLFEAPTVAGLAALIDRLDTQPHSAEQTALPPIQPDPQQRHTPFPLTRIQQAYWIGRQNLFELGNVATHNYSEFNFADLDAARLDQAVRALIARHDMLRAIVRDDGQQQILEHVPAYQVRVLDLRDQPADQVEPQIEAVRQELSHQVLPLGRWPLFEIRATLLSAGQALIHISVDALICDAWSRALLGRELLQLYREQAALPQLEVSFRDYVLAEEALRQQPIYRRAQEYWLGRLPTLPAAPELPLAVQPGSLTQPHFVRRSGRIAPQDWQQLKTRARQAGLTPSGLICAAYAEVLAFWSSQPRFTINLTLFNRLPLHPQINDLVGDFTSLILLSIDSTQATFEQRARNIQRQLWNDIDHRYFSGVEVLRELTRQRGGGTQAVMPIVLTSTLVDDGRETTNLLAPWQENLTYSISQTPQVFLDHAVSEQGGALVFRWDAVEELFPAGMLDDMFAAYSGLLQRLVASEAAWHSATRHALLPAHQRATRAAVNATAAPRADHLLHTLVAARAAQQPHQPAIIAPDRTLSYAQLQRASTALATTLRQHGAQPNTLVALLLPKGWPQLVAALAVLEAGAAYLPLDPDLPPQRRAALLHQAQATLVLTTPALRAELAWPAGLTPLPVDDALLAAPAAAPLTPVQTPADLAYVIFTSGSTGTPKGVMLDHRAVVNTLLDLNQRFGITPDDRVLALSALTFDLSVYDLFGVLAAGGSVVLPAPERRRDPAHWLQLLHAHRVTLWNTVPALLDMLVTYVSGQAATLPATLRQAWLSGDWIPLTLPARAWALQPTLQLHSLGGATEAAIWSIGTPITHVDPAWTSIPYGRPLENQWFAVLNARGEPCPDWVPGQLVIGGAGLAQGYWRAGATTVAQFVPDHLSGAAGGRLYRTGDLGRYWPDGTIEFLGRADDQVKVQGHRIELGEIEAALAQHPQVRAAVVQALGERHGPKRLVGYVVPADERPLTESDLRRFLQAKLPDYMIPAGFMLLESIPLSANGKVDRKALPQFELAAPPTPTIVAPRSPIEEIIAGVFSSVLRLGQVGIHDNFFALGGDSVVAIQLVSRLYQALGIEIPLRRLFETPTSAGLAAFVAETRQPHAHDQPIQPIARDGELPLSSAQQRLWFLCQLEPNSSFYNLPAAARLLGELDVAALSRSLNAVIERHEALRAIFPAVRGRATQTILPSLQLTLTPVDLQHTPAAEREERARQLLATEAERPFDLQHGPLVRALLLRLSPAEHIVLVTMHHIISDAWSIEILLRELAALYALHSGGDAESRLPELRVQFVDLVAAQQRWLAGSPGAASSPIVEQQLGYWQRQLAAPLPALNLPLDRPRTAARSFRGARRPIVLSAELTESLRQLSQRESTTLFITLLTAYYAALHGFTGQTDLLISTSIAGRKGLESEALIGFFLNTLLLRADLGGQPSFIELLRRVRTVALQAYAHQDVPFDMVLKAVRTERELSYAPLTTVVFGMRNAALQSHTLHNLTMQPIEVYRGMAKFDLELQIVQDGQQLRGMLEYNADLFEPTTIERLARGYEQILAAVVAQPAIDLRALVMGLAPQPKEKPLVEKPNREQSLRSKLSSFKPTPVAVSTTQLIKQSYLQPDQTLPLVIEPNLAGVELVGWIKGNLELLRRELPRHGGVLFRNFALGSIDTFEQFVKTIAPETLEYTERSTPRSLVSGNVYTSTEYPADQHIPFHNENSYSHIWPMKIWFYCVQPAQQGGATPIADSRAVYQRLDPAIRERMARTGVMYVRNYGSRLDLPWQDAFQTSDRAAVERYCRSANIAFEWLDQNRLRTRQVRQAVARHPETGEMVWFNQAHLFHVSSLSRDVRDSLVEMFGEEGLPRNTYYGDGTPLEETVLDEIRAAYQQVAISFPWQQGDVLILDNMLVAHSRAPFVGPRRVVVSMAQPYSQPFQPTSA